jgi:CHRD domain
MRISISRRDIIILMACLTGTAASVASSQAAPLAFKVALTGAKQVPPVQTAAAGTADLTYDPATRSLTWSVSYNGLSGPATMAHFHGPATEGKNGPPVIWLKEKGAAVESPIKGEATLTPEQAQQLMAGEWYTNVHTQANPSGEIRGQVMPPKG